MSHVPELAGEVSRGMLFGECSGNFLESAETERREKEKKIKLEKKKREAAIRKSEEEKQRQELEDFKFALEEEKRLNQVPSALRFIGGRGQRSAHLTNDHRSLRGRKGFQNSQDHNEFFRRERQIRNHLNRLPGGEGIHSNNNQIQFWLGKPQEQYTSFYPVTDQEEYEGEQNYSNIGRVEDNQSLQSNSPSPFDTSQASETSSFQSCSSSVTTSPVFAPMSQPEAPELPLPERLSPQEQKHAPRQKRRNRIAANFSNVKENDTSESKTHPQEDFFAVTSSGARHLAPSGSQTNDTVSINNVCASQRIITPTSNMSAVILRHLSKNRDFILNDNDFPPLK